MAGLFDRRVVKLTFAVVARFAKEIGASSVLCLTATATPRVADDICDAFGVEPANVFRTTPYRPK